MKRTIELPCDVGDILWFIDTNEDGRHDVSFSLVDKITCEIKADFNPEMIFNIIHLVGFLDGVSFDDIGKSVFLTKEEAQEKLKELRRRCFR